MTVREAIEVIDKKTIPRNDGLFYEVAEAKEIIKSVFIDRQTPQKPCMTKDLSSYCCPNCHAKILAGSLNCRVCGQAIGWAIIESEAKEND